MKSLGDKLIWLERGIDVAKVIGSNPISPTKRKYLPLWWVFSFVSQYTDLNLARTSEASCDRCFSLFIQLLLKPLLQS